MTLYLRFCYDMVLFAALSAFLCLAEIPVNGGICPVNVVYYSVTV